MPSSIEKIVDGFPFQTIDPIVGTPDYESIAEIHLKFNSNAASVQSNFGCGTLVLLFLNVSPDIYNTLSAVAFVPPVNPEPEPAIPAGATGSAIANLRYHHAVATNVLTEYENTDKSLCWLLLASIDEIYARSLRHKYIRYGRTTTRSLLEHLYTTYANISASSLQDNDMRLRYRYDRNQPFKTLIYQVKNVVEYASARDTPYTPD